MKKILIIGLTLFTGAMSACKKDAHTEIQPQPSTTASFGKDGSLDNTITFCAWAAKDDTLKITFHLKRGNTLSVKDSIQVEYFYTGKDKLPDNTVIAFAYRNTAATVPVVLYPSPNVPQGNSFAANDQPFPTLALAGKTKGSVKLGFDQIIDVPHFPANYYTVRTSYIEAYLRIPATPPNEDPGMPFGHDVSDSKLFTLTH